MQRVQNTVIFSTSFECCACFFLLLFLQVFLPLLLLQLHQLLLLLHCGILWIRILAPKGTVYALNFVWRRFVNLCRVFKLSILSIRIAYTQCKCSWQSIWVLKRKYTEFVYLVWFICKKQIFKICYSASSILKYIYLLKLILWKSWSYFA